MLNLHFTVQTPVEMIDDQIKLLFFYLSISPSKRKL